MRMFHGILLAGLAACGTEPSDAPQTGDTGPGADALAIVGSYVDGFGSEHQITDVEWTQTYPGSSPLVFHVASYDNDQQVLIAHNDEQNAYSGGLWSRFDWAFGSDGHLYYCQSAFEAPSEALAAEAPRAYDSDPASDGCGGFPWTDLTP